MGATARREAPPMRPRARLLGLALAVGSLIAAALRTGNTDGRGPEPSVLPAPDEQTR